MCSVPWGVQYCGLYLEYLGGVQYRGGYSRSLFEYLHGTDSNGTQDIPHGTHDIPHGTHDIPTEHPHGSVLRLCPNFIRKLAKCGVTSVQATRENDSLNDVLTCCVLPLFRISELSVPKRLAIFSVKFVT